jgi:CHASE2 domain-containing sensor protein
MPVSTFHLFVSLAVAAFTAALVVWRAPPESARQAGKVILLIGIVLSAALLIGRAFFVWLGWSASVLDRPLVLGASVGFAVAGFLLLLKPKT